MRRLIVNGDDYGYTPEKCRGILKSHRDGILTSTTVMINAIAAEEVEDILRVRDTLGIGLHLNITFGRPVSPAADVPTLVNEKGVMFRPTVWEREVWDRFGDAKNSEEVALEFRRQLEEFRRLLRIEPSHLDSHHFSASHRKLLPLIRDVAEENGLPVRLPAWIKKENCFEIQPDLADEVRRRCRTTDRAIFDFFCDDADPVKKFKDALRSLPEGTTEIMVHPAFSDPNDAKNRRGMIDLALLTDEGVGELIIEERIHLIDYRNI